MERDSFDGRKRAAPAKDSYASCKAPARPADSSVKTMWFPPATRSLTKGTHSQSWGRARQNPCTNALDAGLMRDGAFTKPLIMQPKKPAPVLIQIAHLYDIERRLRRQRAGPALRDAYRTGHICAYLQTDSSGPAGVVPHPMLPTWLRTRFDPLEALAAPLSGASGRFGYPKPNASVRVAFEP